MQTLNFLKSVLPSQGNYCWVTIKDKRAKQGFVATIEELARTLKEKDAKGIDAYFACASFSEAINRKSENALAVKAFWLDIDAGPGKPYTDASAAVAALDTFCTSAALPFAVTVCSGNGVHAWWPLDRELDTKEWKEYAGRLKSLCERYQFFADPSRTADISSILRAPGTRNFKDAANPRAVSLMEFAEEEGTPTPGLILASLDTARVDVVKDWETLKPKEIDLEQGYPEGQRTDALVKRCGLLFGPARNSTLEQGIEELRTWNLRNNPPLPDSKLCSTAKSIFGRESTKRQTSQQGSLGGDKPGTVCGLPRLPLGYKWNAAGRMTTEVPVEGDEGEETLETVEITQFPLYLLSVTKKEREEAQSYIFCLKLPHEEWREFGVLCNDFESSSWKSCMAQHTGHVIVQDKLFRNYVHHADSELRRNGMDAIRYQQFGWKDDDTSYLVGDTLIHAGGKAERVYGGEEIVQQMKQMVQRKGGSLDAWTQEANLLFSDKYIHLGYALVASFATPLLKFCMGESDGGFVLSITSSGSGKGKTRTVEAATSVWGELESLQITPRDTLNAQMAIVTRACNLPIFMDEWNEKDSGIQAKFLRQLTVGHDKNRAQRDGTVKSKPASYKTLLITTSNHSIYELMNMINDEAAAARVVEISAPDLEGDTFKKFDKIASTMLRNSGYAGREFIFQLMQPGVLDDIKEQLTTAITRIREHLQTQGKHRYITVLPAAVLVTANFLVKHGILEFDVPRLVRWSFGHVSHRVHDRSVTPGAEVLGSFLMENVSRILVVDKAFKSGHPCMILNNMGIVPSSVWARAERDPRRLYLTTHPFRLWCVKNNYDFENIQSELEKGGILLDRKKKVSLGAGTSAAFGRTNTWELDMAIDLMGGEISSVQPSELAPQ